MPRHIFAKPLKHTYTRTPPLEVWKKREIKPSEFQDDIGLQTQPGFTHLGFSTRSLQKCFSLTMSRCTPELMPRSTFAKNIKTYIHENYTTWLVERKRLLISLIFWTSKKIWIQVPWNHWQILFFHNSHHVHNSSESLWHSNKLPVEFTRGLRFQIGSQTARTPGSCQQLLPQQLLIARNFSLKPQTEYNPHTHTQEKIKLYTCRELRYFTCTVVADLQ